MQCFKPLYKYNNEAHIRLMRLKFTWLVFLRLAYLWLLLQRLILTN